MKKKNKGFTLVEVLVALTILSVGIMAVMKLFPMSLRQARGAAERTSAGQLASSQLGELRILGARDVFNLAPLRSVDVTYSIYEGYRRTITRLKGADEVYLQRVTLSVEMADGRVEQFVTYVARQ